MGAHISKDKVKIPDARKRATREAKRVTASVEAFRTNKNEVFTRAHPQRMKKPKPKGNNLPGPPQPKGDADGFKKGVSWRRRK